MNSLLKYTTAFLSSSLVVLIFTSYSLPETQQVLKHKKPCGGAYTIIEYGVGIDCNGDTVQLEKIHGIQTLAKR